MNAHPSRSVPLCVNCVHYQRRGECDHPSVSVSPVDGLSGFKAWTMREDQPPRFAEKFGFEPCGRAGALFVIRDGDSNVAKRLGDLVQGGADIVLKDVGQHVDSASLDERPD